jgi:hypothetical protein
MMMESEGRGETFSACKALKSLEMELESAGNGIGIS